MLSVNFNTLVWKIVDIMYNFSLPRMAIQILFNVHTETFTCLGVAPFGTAPIIRELILSLEPLQHYFWKF